jgi:hypothetical protein
LAIVAGMAFIIRNGFRYITKADLVEDATQLSAFMKRASQLAIEHGEMHRVVIDFEKHKYGIEACKGTTTLVRNEKIKNDDEETKRALERGKQRMQDLPTDAFAAGDPDESMKRTMAVSGHHIADKQCGPAASNLISGITSGRPCDKDDDCEKGLSCKEKQCAIDGSAFNRKLKSEKGIKFKEVWVQHRDDSETKGQVAIYFFPAGSAEKAVVELTDGGTIFTILVHGLTGRIELKDGQLRDADEHMLRNALGDKDAEREEKK